MRRLSWLAVIATWSLCLGQGPQRSAPGEPEDTRLLVLGQVTWAGLDWIPAGGVLAARDPRFKEVVASAPLNREGRFALFVEPGLYYLMAYVDVNASGQADPPDGIGFYGVQKPADAPAALDISPDSAAETIVMEIVFQLGEDRKLKQAARGADAALGRVRGAVHGTTEGPTYVVCWPAGDGWIGHASLAATDGSFEVCAPAGDYVLFAVSDLDGDGLLEPGEGAGVLADGAALRVLRVLPQGLLEIGALELNGTLGEASQVKVGEQVIDLPCARTPALCRLVVPEDLGALPKQVLLFADAKHKTLIASAWVPAGALVALAPATYHLVCGFDRDGDGRLGPGDALAAPQLANARHGLSVQEGALMDVPLGEPVALSQDMVEGKQPGGRQ